MTRKSEPYAAFHSFKNRFENMMIQADGGETQAKVKSDDILSICILYSDQEMEYRMLEQIFESGIVKKF